MARPGRGSRLRDPRSVPCRGLHGLELFLEPHGAVSPGAADESRRGARSKIWARSSWEWRRASGVAMRSWTMTSSATLAAPTATNLSSEERREGAKPRRREVPHPERDGLLGDGEDI